MPIQHPKRRPAFPPIGRLRTSPISGGGKKSLMTSLNLTAMVDMFTVIVIFLLQMFSANGDLQFMVKGLKTPTAKETQLLEERGPVVTLFQNQVLFEGEPVVSLEEIDNAEMGIPKLTETLRGIREREEQIYGRDETKPFDGHIIVQSDKSTDFKLVRKTLESANMAGWAHLQFTVTGEAKGTVDAEGGGEG